MGDEMNRNDIVVTARGVSKQFFRKGRDSARYFDAVAPCDVDLHAGELVVLMGRSGSGKSTLLNMLAGLLEPTHGAVEFQGRDLYRLDDVELSRLRNECFGVVPQGHTALQSLTVIENVTLPCLMYRSDGESAERRAFDLLEQMGIAALADSRPAELSGGELRRMAIARALVNDPQVVFADEPTGDLDDENTEAVLRALRSYADAGAAVLVVTHETSAADVADRVLRMDAGSLS